MHDILVWAAELPHILVYAVIAGLAGGGGVLISAALKTRIRRNLRFLPIILTAISTLITSNFILPALDKVLFVQGFRESVGEVPRQIDEISFIQEADVYGDEAIIVFKISIDIEDLEATTLALTESLKTQETCKLLLGAKGYISKFTYNYDTNLGRISITLNQSECL